MSSTVESPELDQVESTVSRGGPTLMQIAWQRKSLVILGIMLGLVLGLLYYAQSSPPINPSRKCSSLRKHRIDQLNFGQAAKSRDVHGRLHVDAVGAGQEP